MFKFAIEALLKGEVICKTAQPELHEYLCHQPHANKVDEYLAPLDRSLIHLEQSGAFYCSYTVVDENNRAAISHTFSEIRRYFRPLVTFLELVLRATSSDLPLRGGDKLSFAKVLHSFEHDNSLSEPLRQLTLLAPFKTNKLEVREQLTTVFKKLEELGFLVRLSESGLIYFATAKFDLIYQLIEFINDSEQLQLDEQPQSQEALL